MADALGMMKGMLPSFSGMGSTIMYIGIGGLIAGLIGIAAFLYFQNKRFNKKIILYKTINGVEIEAGNYQGMFQKVGFAGDYWLFIRGIGKIVPRPKIEHRKDTYLYYEREDGEWINVGLKFNKEQAKMDMFYIDEDMRLSRVAIQKNLQQRLQKETFWQQYGTMLMTAGFLIIIGILSMILFGKVDKMIDKIGGMMSVGENILKLTLSTCGKGSGMIPVNMTGGVPI